MLLPRSPNFPPDERSFHRWYYLITGFRHDERAWQLQARGEHGGNLYGAEFSERFYRVILEGDYREMRPGEIWEIKLHSRVFKLYSCSECLPLSPLLTSELPLVVTWRRYRTMWHETMVLWRQLKGSAMFPTLIQLSFASVIREKWDLFLRYPGFSGWS